MHYLGLIEPSDEACWQLEVVSLPKSVQSGELSPVYATLQRLI